MDLGLNERVALVAAASRGLGRAIAEELAGEGASLILCARGRRALEAAAQEIEEKAKVPVLSVASDVSVQEDVARIVESGLDRFGHIDILVTNAGGPPAGEVEGLGRGGWDAA